MAKVKLHRCSWTFLHTDIDACWRVLDEQGVEYEVVKHGFGKGKRPEVVGLSGQRLLPVLELELEPGAAFRFKTQPQPGWDGIVNCRFLEIEAPRKLRYAWVVGDMDTVVTFTLAPTASGTRLSLVQSGFRPDQKQNFGGARYGWKMMGGKLVELLARIP